MSTALQNYYMLVVFGIFELLTVINIILKYKVTAVNIRRESVAFVRGAYSKNTMLVPTDRIESAEAISSIFKKKQGVCHIRMKYFAPTQFSSLTAKNMNYEQFYELEKVLKL